jgi:hypothetical protein
MSFNTLKSTITMIAWKPSIVYMSRVV